MLSDASTRQHYIEAPRPNWRAFFDACGEDPVIEEVRRLLDLLDPELRIVLLTARPHRVHELTEAWLRRYQIRWDLLVMRPWGDYELARDFKQSTVWELRSAGFDLGSRSRTTAATSRCSVPRASPASTSIRATTTELCLLVGLASSPSSTPQPPARAALLAPLARSGGNGC